MVDKKNKTQETELNFNILKKNWNWIILILILLIGFNLRMDYLDYPVIGYHNWKETHYLVEARNFAEDGDWLVPKSGFPWFTDNMEEGAHGDTFPVTSWVVGIAFKIFGIDVGVARMTSILFVMASVLLLYLIINLLFKREDLALMTALVAATNPLLVFFGRQVQGINPALFFSLLGVYLYLLWLKDDLKNTKLIVGASLAIVIGFITQYSFGIIMIPILAIFPYKKVFNKKYLETNWKMFVSALLPALLIPLWLYNNLRIIKAYAIKRDIGTAVYGDIYYDFAKVFTPQFKTMIKAFIADNYTFMGFFLAIVGLALIILTFKKNRGYIFTLAYAIGTVPWVVIMSSKLAGHNYHQYPVAPLMIILIAFCFTVIASTLSSIIKIKQAKWIILILLFLLLIYPPFFKTSGGIIEAKDRQFPSGFMATVFPGVDIAGEYIKTHSQPDERIFFSGHQSHGIIWHADRMGTGSMNLFTPEQMREAEEKYNYQWVFAYSWAIPVLSDPVKGPAILDYYSLKSIAFVQVAEGQLQPVYYLFKKGGSTNLTQIQQTLQTLQPQIKEYKTNTGSIELIVFEI